MIARSKAAAAWRDQLRTGDILAWIGGEEFGLLLLDCDAPTATEVIDRLLDHVTHNRTCSGGIAIQIPGEPPESAIQRADTALYQAKAHGRNQARYADPHDTGNPPSARDRT